MSGSTGEPDQVPGARLLDLVQVMARLRTGCPWDARQTHESLTPFLLEETYEAVEALDAGDPDAVREELGDVLLQVVFHAAVAAERTDGTGYTIDDIADGIVAKLTRRHPHVFGDAQVSGPDEVKANWDAIKAAERAAAGGGPSSALDGVPLAQPALALAAALQRRAERAGAPPELADLAGPAGEPAPALGPSARPGPSCSPSSPALARSAWTPSTSCGPPPAPTGSGSGPGSTAGPSLRAGLASGQS